MNAMKTLFVWCPWAVCLVFAVLAFWLISACSKSERRESKRELDGEDAQ